MADTPFGFRPVQHLDGAPFNGKVKMYLYPSSASGSVFVGDAVKSAGSAGAAGVTVNGQDVEGMPTIAVAAGGDTLRGVVVGFLPDQDNLMKKHRTTSTNRIALVSDGPDVVFEVQEDSIGANIAATNVGANVDLVATAGSTVTGLSKFTIDSSAVESTTTSAQFRILGLAKRPDNAIGSFGKWLVLINEHELKSTSGV